jgi:hypothetical protein
MIGDQTNMLRRLRALLPRWFPDSTPVLDTLLAALASTWAALFDMTTYAGLQLRVRTATDDWLDLVAADFFGAALVRRSGEADAGLRTRITIALLRERATRAALIRVLTDMTGRAPVVIEPTRPADTGGYGLACGYGVAGSYGSLAIPYWCFVQALRPEAGGIPDVAGYGTSPGGYSTPSRAEYAVLSDSRGAVTDAAIYAAIDSVRPAGTTIWVAILDNAPDTSCDGIGISWTIGASRIF